MTGVTASCPRSPPPRALPPPGGLLTPSRALLLASHGRAPPPTVLAGYPCPPTRVWGTGLSLSASGLSPPCATQAVPDLPLPPGPVAFLACLGMAAGLALLVYCCPPGGSRPARPRLRPHEAPAACTRPAQSPGGTCVPAAVGRWLSLGKESVGAQAPGGLRAPVGEGSRPEPCARDPQCWNPEGWMGSRGPGPPSAMRS